MKPKRIPLSNRKGITPIISVILLLMMTIAIAGLAYTWLQRMQTTVQTSTLNASDEVIIDFKARLSVDGYFANCSPSTAANATNVTIYVKNKGSIPTNNLQLFVDDALQAGQSNTTLGVGNQTAYRLNGQSCFQWINQSRVLKVVSDETTAENTFKIKCGTTTIC